MFASDPTVAKNPVIEERRLGRFAYSNQFLLSIPPQALRNVFSKVIPVDVRFDYAQQCFAVTGFSEEFEPIEQGSEIPQYQLSIRIVGSKKKKQSYYVKFTPTNNLSALFS